MTDVEPADLASLLDEVRRELGTTVDELDRSRAAHRRVESLLLAVLDHVPVPIVVLDDELRVRAVSAAAERAWGATVDAPASAVDELGGAVETCRQAFELGYLSDPAVGADLHAAMLDEPGTGARYIAVWPG